MTMLDERFSAWFESVEFGSDSERLGALRVAATSIAGDARPADALDLVAYAGGRNVRSAFAIVLAAASEADETFVAATGDLESRLLASAAVAAMLDSGGTVGEVACEAVLSAEFAGLEAPIEELPQLARTALARRLRRPREETSRDNKLDPVRSEVRNILDGDISTSEQISRLASVTQWLIGEFTSSLAGLERRVETRLDLADEELDILWWAFGATGADETRFGWDFQDAVTLLRTGHDLAAYHRFHAEVPSALAIVRRLIGSSATAEYTIADVVESAAEHVAFDPVQPGPLLPILTSCAECLSFRDAEVITLHAPDSWIPSVGRFGVDPTIRRRGDEIAVQTLREVLISRALSA